MADTRTVELLGLNEYVQLSIDDSTDFSGTVDNDENDEIDVRVHRTDAATKPVVGGSALGRPVRNYDPIERQTDGFYWVRGNGKIIIDDLA